MMHPYLFFFLLVAYFSDVAASQGHSSVQSPWKMPPGTDTNFTTAFRNGQTVRIAWDGWASDWHREFLDGQPVKDLWLIAHDYPFPAFSLRLAEGFYVSQTGSCLWHVNIPYGYLILEGLYLLRFINPAPGEAASFDHTARGLSSPSFQVATDSGPAGTQPTAASVPAATGTSSSSAPATPPAASFPGKHLSKGAKAGIGIGATVGGMAVIAVFGLLAVLLRRRMSLSSVVENQAPNHMLSNPPVTDNLHGVQVVQQRQAVYEVYGTPSGWHGEPVEMASNEDLR